jgi:hypothetical protein
LKEEEEEEEEEEVVVVVEVEVEEEEEEEGRRTRRRWKDQRNNYLKFSTCLIAKRHPPQSKVTES